MQKRKENPLASESDIRDANGKIHKPTAAQLAWLKCGLTQPGGKLPIFDSNGKRISDRTIKSCIENGWAEPWFNNPVKPDWQVCKLTKSGQNILSGNR